MSDSQKSEIRDIHRQGRFHPSWYFAWSQVPLGLQSRLVYTSPSGAIASYSLHMHFCRTVGMWQRHGLVRAAYL